MRYVFAAWHVKAEIIFVSLLAKWFVLCHTPTAIPRNYGFSVLPAKTNLRKTVVLAVQRYTFVMIIDSHDSEWSTELLDQN